MYRTGTKSRNFSHVQHKTSKTKLLRSLDNGIKEFSEFTSLHGFKYIGESKLMPGKVFWTCVLITVFILCGFQTYALTKYWIAGKIIMTQETSNIHVWDIPFPAVTICSENQVNRTKMNTAKYHLPVDDHKDLQDYADMMCYSNFYGNYTNNPIGNAALKYAFENLAAPCNKTVVSFIWINDFLAYSCQYFQPIVIDMGLCFSHNIIPFTQLIESEYLEVFGNPPSYHWAGRRHIYQFYAFRSAKSFTLDEYFYKENVSEINWHPAVGFRRKTPFMPPWRVTGTGVYNSVKIVLDLSPENFPNYCNVSGNGMSIIVHNPLDLPQPYNSLFVRPNTYNVVLVSPELVTVSTELHNWSPFVRGCYFPGEKYLRFFKVYSMANCEMECRANKTLRVCGCAAYSHPRRKTTPVCGLDKRRCILSVGGSGFKILGRANEATVAENTYYLKNCLCLPPCNDLTYNFDVTVMKTNNTNVRNFNSVLTPDRKHSTVLEIYFKRDAIDEWRRSPMIRFAELAANIGGIMSLWLGCSIISLFEVIYFVTLRRRSKKFVELQHSGNNIGPKNNNAVSIFIN